jgi:two-component system sensor histidine kinase ComP
MDIRENLLKRAAFFVGLCLTLLLTVHFTESILNRPYVGVYTQIGGTTVVSVAPYSWGEAAGIRPGDRVLSIDREAPEESASVRKYGVIGQAKEIEVRRGSALLRLNVENSLSKKAVLFYLIIPYTFLLVCFSALCFLFARKERSRAVKLLTAFLFIVGPILLEMSANARHDAWSLRLTGFSLVFAFILLVHFLKAYFARFGFILASGPFIACLYMIGTMIVVGSALQAQREVSAYYPQELIFSVFVFGILCLQLIRLYIRIKETEYRHLIEILFAGFFLAAFPFVIFYALPNMLFGTSLIPVEWTTPVIIILPLTLCFLVLSDSFIDMTFYIGRFSYYSLLSFTMTVLVLLTGLTVMHESLVGNPKYVLGVGILTFCAGLLALYEKDFLDSRLKRLIDPKEKKRRDELNRFLQGAQAEYTMEHIEIMLRRAVMSQLPVGQADVVTVKKQGAGGQSKTYDRLKQTGGIPGIWKNEDGFTAVLHEHGDTKTLLKTRWVRPRTLLSLEDRMWLETLLSYARVVAENLYKSERLIQALGSLEADRRKMSASMNRFLFKVAETERRQLAGDLHDTNVQDQLAIAMAIDLERGRLHDPAACRLLAYTRERILDNVDELRRIIRSYYPAAALKAGPDHALAILFDRIRLNAGFYLETDLVSVPAGLPEEDALCIYRICQELLTNAMKHSGARHVWLKLRFVRRHCRLIYRDDGKGVNAAQISPSFSTTGLAGIISRVEGLAGHVTLAAARPHGLLVDAAWPLQIKQSWKGSGENDIDSGR